MKKRTFTYRKAIVEDVPLLVEKEVHKMKEVNSWDEDMRAFLSKGSKANVSSLSEDWRMAAYL